MSAGLQGYDLTAYQSQHGISIVAPGGHSAYTSYLGLGADQVLSIQVVTADADQNADLFYAMRGGGAGTASRTLCPRYPSQVRR